MKSSFLRVAAPLSLGVALVATAALAQQKAAPAPPPTPAQSLFGEQIEVRVVNVEVVVTDKSGNRVPDLQATDLRLKVDGKVTPIEFFSEVRGGQTLAPSAEAAPSAVPGLPGLAPGSPVGTSYLVYIDDYFSVAARRNEVLRSLKDDLTRLGPEDRMAIIAYDGRKLDMLSSWSQNQRELGRAIEQAIGRPAHGLDRVAEKRSFLTSRNVSTNMGINARSEFSNQLDLEERAYADLLANQVSEAVDGAVSTLRGFAKPPGRKVMLLLSGGWPFDPVEYVVSDPTRPILTRDTPGGDSTLRPLVDTANRLGYTLYPVDVPGITGTGADASVQSLDAINVSPAFDRSDQENQATLLYAAQQTGGKALIGGLRAAALKTVEDDTRAYYWLGFTPTWQGNDKRHKIEVEPARPGLKVRSRGDFLDLSRKSEVSYMVESAMLFGNQPGASIGPHLFLELGKPVKSKRGEMEVPVTIGIPVAAVTPIPQGTEYVSEFELRIAARDVKGGRSDVPVVPLRFKTKGAPGPNLYFKYQTKVALRRIKQHVMMAVFDPLSNKITTAESDVAEP
ncbi:MAG TPA: VWA domain-containing protein [Thermoanaerobaculia bacterium]